MLRLCGWSWYARPLTRLLVWLGFDVTHGICVRHSKQFMEGRL